MSARGHKEYLEQFQQHLKQLEAENLAMRKALKEVVQEKIIVNDGEFAGYSYTSLARIGQTALTQTPHTAAFAEYVQALEAVAETANEVDHECSVACISGNGIKNWNSKLTDSLLKLESARNKIK